MDNLVCQVNYYGLILSLHAAHEEAVYIPQKRPEDTESSESVENMVPCRNRKLLESARQKRTDSAAQCAPDILELFLVVSTCNVLEI